MEQYTLLTEKENINTRLDVFIADELDDISRSSVQKLIESGDILVNQKCVKPNYKLRQNDIISVVIPDPVPLEILPEDIPLDILYEDNDLIVIDKPKGMVVHPAPGHYSGTLVNALLYHCKDSLSGINGVARPGIVHRIDKDTSGVIVIAKTNSAHNCLAAQLMEHSMTRVYYAIVFNNIKQDEGTINKPLARSQNDRKKIGIVPGGKHAVTHFKVLERFGKYTFIEARLETGRTHQIRVHMASIGSPLLGDMVYGPAKQPFKLDGQALHAGILGFRHPISNEYMEFISPLPEYFNTVLSRLRT